MTLSKIKQDHYCLLFGLASQLMLLYARSIVSYYTWKFDTQKRVYSCKTYFSEKLLNVILMREGVHYLNNILDEKRPINWVSI